MSKERRLIMTPYTTFDYNSQLFLSAEKNFRRIMGYKDLWTLERILGRSTVTRIDKNKKMA
jgi:hypothetical protein